MQKVKACKILGKSFEYFSQIRVSGFSHLKGESTVSEQLLKEILGELKTVKNEIQEVKTGQQKLETRMENKAFCKLDALFDGYSLSQIEKLQKHLDQRLDSIEIDTRYLVSRVAELEKMIK